MSRIGHLMILASAGSGKTYALTNRFVRLLALGAAPERIVALTFTRKAAGEFFDEILKKLARAAGEPAYAATLAKEIGQPALTPEDFRRMLRTVIDAMHRLRLGTLDGFFARIVRNFPLELGLSGEFELLQEHAARMERGRVLRRMFESSGELADAQREFIEAFKRATFGVDEKRLGAQLDAFLDAHQELYLAASDGALWGDAARIWPEGGRWLGSGGNAEAAAVALRAWALTAPIGDKQRQRWSDFLESVAAWAPGVVPGRPMIYVLEKALDAWSALERGDAVLEFDRKKQELSAAAGAALAVLTRHIVGGELTRRLEMTRGIHAVLAGYEQVYHDAVRRAGKLTFADLQRMLQPDAGGPALSADAATGDRLAIDYRLDAATDHWLLDEFQDTSFGQWSVLRNLIDEVVQDPTGARSFFYVGDVKQAIFAWREGDPALFREIYNHYNAAQPGAIDEQPLVKSYRSAPPVIAAVNRVFGAAGVLTELFPGAASMSWNAEWRAHETAKTDVAGHVALLHAADEEERFATTLAVLQEIDPLARGLSCALLVQSNDTAARLADYLRHAGGLPAVAESDLHVCTDNPFGAALLALAQAAAYPGDTVAQEQLRMSPLGAVLAAEGLDAPEKITARLLREIHADGFERTMGAWARRLETKLAPDDAFTRERSRQFAAAAGLFDATGSRDVAEFVAFMERHTVRESDTAQVLRVMTIHKSKGLGFDVVLLPDLEGTRLDSRRDGLAVQKAPDRSIEWILDLPSKLFYEHDEVLAAHVREAEAAACYEKLSLLYVAMTRAKRAMYLIAKPPGTSVSRNFPKLLGATLGEETTTVRIGGREFAGAYVEGDADWHSRIVAVTASPSSMEATELTMIDAGAARVQRLPARQPSAGRLAQTSGARMFSLEPSAAVEFGLAVHALLAEVEWGGAAVQELVANWRARRVAEEAVAEVEACLAATALAEIWAEPTMEAGASVALWRERAFEVVLDGAWISGVFDRVVVQRDAAGRASAATVVEFKTDRLAAGEAPEVAAERHAEQLAIYRRAVAMLTGLAIDRVAVALVFTAARRALGVA